MNFEAYLVTKKIDSKAFQQAEPLVWNSWNLEFEQMHPTSFTAQKLYLINPVRRKYPLNEPVTVHSEAPAAVAVRPKPVMRPKPKIG